MCFFVKQRTAYEMRISDWSSDVCSSDLMAQHVDLARHFRAADHRCDRMCRIAERGVERLQFGLHRAPRISGKPARDALGRTMRAVRRRKGIVDVKVADFGERVGKGRIVLFLAGMEARIFRSEEHTSELQSLMSTPYA